jgi:hypothetical protein
MEHDITTKDSVEVVIDEAGLLNRRDFLDRLGKWSKIVIGAAVFGGTLVHAGRDTEAAGAAWANRGGGGGAAWANRAGGGAWANRGTAWVNHGGGAAWANRGSAWANHGSAWINRY